jgi:hypothetical protein
MDVPGHERPPLPSGAGSVLSGKLSLTMIAKSVEVLPGGIQSSPRAFRLRVVEGRRRNLERMPTGHHSGLEVDA